MNTQHLVEENMKIESGNGFLETTTAILIAVVAVLIALVSWRASIIEDAAGDADYTGLRATIYSVRANALNSVNAYESYGNYVNYLRNNRMNEMLSDDLETIPEDEQAPYYQQMKISTDLADANRDMFESQFLNRDGSYSVQRQLGVLWADAAKENDMNYQSQFDEADKGRAQTRKMLIAVMILSIATVFFALVESVEGRSKIIMAAVGTIVSVAGIVVSLLIQFKVW
jgi:hypothetical protein